MKLEVTMAVLIKEEGILAFVKNMIVKQMVKSSTETVIENDMMRINVTNIKEVK